MKDFSIFEQAFKLSQSFRPEDLGEVSNLSRRDFDERETFLFRAQVPALEYVSLLIENALLLRTNRAGRVYVGFEGLSRMEPVIDRYLRIADLSERVYVFGVPDWQPPRHPNMKLIHLADDYKMAREWFIIADSSTFRAALLGIDEDGPNLPSPEARYFRAFKSCNPAIIRQLAATIEGFIDLSLAA